jgi:hypothetical protein
MEKRRMEGPGASITGKVVLLAVAATLLIAVV